ncbi:SRPBCC domain-containing protein [Sorangium sp. So ce260]|uniref:SRPBCC family protein n=1 Tax=Sorangium sp. So ce260 TaxID=3133291 RepID=UPI003F63C98F
MNATVEKASILVERTYPASVSELWELWATKDGFESWWGPEGFRVEVHALEPKKDGLLHYTMIADSPKMIEAMKRGGQPTSHEVRARFSAFSPQKTLTITSVIDFLPGVEVYESNIEVLFTPLANGAHMAVTLHAMHDPHFTEMQRAGFTSQLGKLDRRYTK